MESRLRLSLSWLSRLDRPPGRLPSTISDGTDHATLPALSRLATTLALATLEASAVGFAGWALADRRLVPAYARDNVLSRDARRMIFVNVGGALAVACLVLLATLVMTRRKWLDVAERMVRRAAPLSLAALAVLLFDARLWRGRDLVFLSLVLGWGFGVRAVVRTVVTTPPVFPWLARGVLPVQQVALEALGRVGRRIDAPLLSVVGGACAYAIYLSVISIAQHSNLVTSAFDMGGWDNLMWNLVHRGPLLESTPFMGRTGSHLARHATFFAYVLGPIYAISPRPETLLVLQAVILGAAAVPLHLYARLHLPAWSAALVAWLYLIYPPLHGANLYDFQFLPLGIPFLWLLLFAAETGRRWTAIVAALLALSVREDVACCVGVLGIWLLLRGRSARAGAVLAAVGMGYFAFMKLGVMPRFASGAETFVEAYAGLLPSGEHTFAGVLKTIAANPPFVANVLLDRDKLVYGLQILAPVLLLPLARPLSFLLLVPGCLFTLMSTGCAPLIEISFQYSAYWIPFVFVALVIELERAAQPRHPGDGHGVIRRRSLAAGVAAASLACSYLYGAIAPHEPLRCGFDKPHFAATPEELQAREQLAALAAQVPADARIAASEHLLPHVSGRRYAYTLRVGVEDADYLLFALPMRNDERDKAYPLLSDGTFGVVDDRGRMALARRGAPTGRNAAVLDRM